MKITLSGEVVEEQLREFYEELFLKKVADSRQRPVEEIRELAEGRVWTGAQALGNGLLDRQGGLVQALEAARQAAGLPKEKKVRVVRYARRRSLRHLFQSPWQTAFPAIPCWLCWWTRSKFGDWCSGKSNRAIEQ